MSREKLTPEVDQIIAQVPGWIQAKYLRVQPLAGLTNTNYRVTVDGERFVLRVSGNNTNFLGISRNLEMEALFAASESGICPRVEYFLLPEGHLVTRYIDGQHLTLEAYRRKESVYRIVEKVKRLHDLPPIKAIFSPFRRVEKYAALAGAMDVNFPCDFDRMRQKMVEIEQDQSQDHSHWFKCCHNDPFFVNVLDDGDIWFIDWEFAGVGDIYSDLATLTYVYDSPDTLSPELQKYLLACYFGEVSKQNRSRLAGMKFMLMLFSAMWSLLQQGLQNKGFVREIEGFDFLNYANQTLESIIEYYRI